jgi:hypothetical protein
LAATLRRGVATMEMWKMFCTRRIWPREKLDTRETIKNWL